MRRILVGSLFSLLVAFGAIDPAQAEESKQYRDFTLSAGIVSNGSQTIFNGFNFTSQISPAFVQTLGFEMGDRTLGNLMGSSQSDTLSALWRLRAAITTNSWFYLGAGATYTKISVVNSLTAGGSDTGSVEGIVGLRIPLFGGVIGAEYRAGFSGLSTGTVSVGMTI